MAGIESFDLGVVQARVQGLVDHVVNEEFWMSAGRLQNFLPVLPAWIVMIYLFNRSNSGEIVQMTSLASTILVLHGCYFFFCSLLLELAADAFAVMVDMHPMALPGPMYPIQTAFNDFMMVCGTFYLFMALQREIPRWTMYIVVTQCVYNLGNDYRWYHGDYYGPNGTKVDFFFILTDLIFISLGFLSSVFFLLTATPSAKMKLN